MIRDGILVGVGVRTAENERGRGVEMLSTPTAAGRIIGHDAPIDRDIYPTFSPELATELATEQLAVIQALGGWSQPQVVVSRYQKVPVEVQREVLAKRRIG